VSFKSLERSHNVYATSYDDTGVNARPALDPQDRYNNSLLSYLQVPQQRWMVNSFAHYDLAPKVTAYAEFHFSDNKVTQLPAPGNADGTFLFNDNNPYLNPQTQGLLAQLDAADPYGRTFFLNARVKF
jgi:iron complex outermembrane recepter protein